LTFETVCQMVFGKTAEELEMHVVYDVSHNICKVCERESVCVREREIV
jgi:RNA-splicing ligase RtcB